MEIKVFRRDWSEKLKKRKEEDDMSKELEALRRIKKSHFIAMSCLIGRNRDIETENALETIEQALKRNEPMKVDPETFASHSWGDFYNCPNCGETVRIYDNYCPYCGQALDWSDEK